MKQISFNLGRLAAPALAALILTAATPSTLARKQAASPARKPDAAEAKWVEDTLRALSLRQRVAQLVVVAAQVEYMNFEGDRFAELRRQVVEHGVGGVQIGRAHV